jgi:phosphatidate cytidylyltransferase
MITRILTAVVLIPLAVALVLWVPQWLFFLGVLPFGLLALWEYLELMGRVGAAPPRLPVYLVALLLWFAAASDPRQLLGVLVAGSLVLFLTAVLRRGGVAEIPSNAAAGVLSLVYVAAPFALMVDLHGAGAGRLLLYLLVLVWVGDTAAYFVGRALGRHKLAPTLSPGKTVEGTVGSVVVTVAVGYWLFQIWFAPSGSMPVHGLLLPLVANVASQLGDLAESALKRSAGVKDSSRLLPGHGGMLDRVDALLFAAPALWYYWTVFIRGGF